MATSKTLNIKRKRAQKKAAELVGQKAQLEASIRGLVQKQLRYSRLSPEKLREAFVINFMMGATSGDIEIVKNEYERKESGYEIIQPLGAPFTTAKLVSARDSFVLAVREGGNLINPVFLIAKPFSIAQDPHAVMRKLLETNLHKYMKAYMFVDSLHMPYSR